jgi:hypothetical protein
MMATIPAIRSRRQSRPARQAGTFCRGQHRAGGAAFRDEPGVLRVRLFGSPEARIVQAARIESIDPPVARQRLPEVDTGR